MRPEALDEARDWLIRAQRDLAVAERVLAIPPQLPDQAAFHAQQAAEKALKAFLAASGRPFPKTHNLAWLLDLCREIDSAFPDFSSAVRILDPYATRFRYPGGPLEPELTDAREAIRLASEIVQSVRDRLFSA